MVIEEEPIFEGIPELVESLGGRMKTEARIVQNVNASSQLIPSVTDSVTGRL